VIRTTSDQGHAVSGPPGDILAAGPGSA